MTNFEVLLLCAISVSLVWIILCWLLKNVYCAVRFIVLLIRESIRNPLFMWEFNSMDPEKRVERFAPLMESIMDDVIYTSLEWFSWPLELIIDKFKKEEEEDE